MNDLIERLRMNARDCVRAADMDTDVILDARQISDIADALNTAADTLAARDRELAEARRDGGRLDYIERTFSGMTNRERYLPVQMIWGKGSNGRTLREACDKYMKRDAAIEREQEKGNG